MQRIQLRVGNGDEFFKGVDNFEAETGNIVTNGHPRTRRSPSSDDDDPMLQAAE